MASVVSSGLSSRFIDMQTHKFSRITADYTFSEFVLPSYEMWQVLQANIYGEGQGTFYIYSPEGTQQLGVNLTGTGTWDINLAPYAYAGGKVRITKNSGNFIEGRIVVGVVPV